MFEQVIDANVSAQKSEVFERYRSGNDMLNYYQDASLHFLLLR